jgi:hypothetical protein
MLLKALSVSKIMSKSPMFIPSYTAEKKKMDYTLKVLTNSSTAASSASPSPAPTASPSPSPTPELAPQEESPIPLIAVEAAIAAVVVGFIVFMLKKKQQFSR